MDRKAQIGFGAIIISAIAILIGLAFYTGTFSQSIGAMTRTYTNINQSFTLPAAGSTSELTVCGQKAVTIAIINQTDSVVVPASNYTISQSAGADGYLAAKITANAGWSAGKLVNVTCEFQPKGYIESGASRNIVGLIAIFMAILIMIAALPDVRDKFFDWLRN